MKITSDWHIHTCASYDDVLLTQADLIADASECGISDFGIADHLNTPFNIPDIEAGRAVYDSLPKSPGFHFGVELSCVSQWEIDEIATGKYDKPYMGIREGGPANSALAIGISSEDVERIGFDYVIAGVHFPMYCPIERDEIIRDYHRQNMFLVTHPLVTIVAHPWWWYGPWQDSDGMFRTDPWFDDFCRVPQSMHDEFAAAARENGKVIEVNLEAMVINPLYTEEFKRQYLDYLAWLNANGVQLSIGSDCHSKRYNGVQFDKAAAVLSLVGFTDETFWRMPRQDVDLSAELTSL